MRSFCQLASLWHKAAYQAIMLIISFVMADFKPVMTLIINVGFIMRYADRLTDVFLATYQYRYFHVE